MGVVVSVILASRPPKKRTHADGTSMVLDGGSWDIAQIASTQLHAGAVEAPGAQRARHTPALSKDTNKCLLD